MFKKRKPGERAGDRPQGVFIVNRKTGDRLPCELVYRGLDVEGLHEWAVAAGTVFDVRTEMLQIDMLPPRSTISIDATASPGGDDGP